MNKFLIAKEPDDDPPERLNVQSVYRSLGTGSLTPASDCIGPSPNKSGPYEHFISTRLNL